MIMYPLCKIIFKSQNLVSVELLSPFLSTGKFYRTILVLRNLFKDCYIKVIHFLSEILKMFDIMSNDGNFYRFAHQHFTKSSKPDLQGRGWHVYICNMFMGELCFKC